MNSILRVLLGQWPVILTCVAACLVGGIVVVLTATPRYEGNARVILDYIRPDPVTGAVVHSKAVDAHVASQLRLLRDVQVAGPAVEALGWLDNPDVQLAYAARPSNDRRDFQSWVATLLIVGTNARMVEDSNIMEISYTATSPELAAVAVDALRNAYIESSIAVQRAGARAAAEKLSLQVERVGRELAELEDMQNSIEDEAGVVVGSNGRDSESMRLRNMAKRPPTAVLMEPTSAPPSALLLAALESEIAQRSRNLGPNNPRMIDLQQRREVLQAQVSMETAALRARGSAADVSNRASAALFEEQKAKVLAIREPITRLRLLQDEIKARREELDELMKAVAQNREMIFATSNAITPVGPAAPKDKPVFPNKPLILLGSAGAGLLLGIFMACFVELMARRVRAAQDLEKATNAPVLAVVPDFRRPERTPRRRTRRALVLGEQELSPG